MPARRLAIFACGTLNIKTKSASGEFLQWSFHEFAGGIGNIVICQVPKRNRNHATILEP
jgi:hypothetical protein